MKKRLFLFLLFATAPLLASQDTLAVPTFLHTKVVLAPPLQTGEIVATAELDTQDNVLRFNSLSVTIGDKTISVSKRILECFLGPRLSSVELFSGPPDSPEDTKPGYFNITFKFESSSSESIYTMHDDRPTAWMIIREGVIEKFTKIQKRSETTFVHTDYDATTLKEIRQVTVNIEQ